MKLIGHRGAAGLAPENTVAAIIAAVRVGVDAVEFDVRLSSDQQFILSHDPILLTDSGNLTIATTPFSELTSTSLSGGKHAPSLAEALKVSVSTTAFVEAKGSDWASQLAKALPQKSNTIRVVAGNLPELIRFHEMRPDVPVYPVQRYNPVDILHTFFVARRHGFTGIDMNFWLLNPFIYWLAKQWKLDILVYTVNHAFFVRFLTKLFPNISVITDYPDKMQFMRRS